MRPTFVDALLVEVPAEIIEACKQGDEAAFEELIRLTNASVYTVALRITGNPDDAAEVAQETYIKLLRVIRQFRGESKFSTWLYRVTSNVAISSMRRRSKRRTEVAMDQQGWDLLPGSESDDPAVSVQQSSLRRRLHDAILTLPEEHRAVVVMKDVYGLGFDEIAQQLQVSEGAARVRLFRARKKLRSLLYDEHAERA